MRPAPMPQRTAVGASEAILGIVLKKRKGQYKRPPTTRLIFSEKVAMNEAAKREETAKTEYMIPREM